MEKLFVSYEIAKLLKEKGFDEKCLGFYRIGYTLILVDDKDEYRVTGFRTCKNSQIKSSCISAPLYQQVITWLYDNHKIIISLCSDGTSTLQTNKANIEGSYDEIIIEALKETGE